MRLAGMVVAVVLLAPIGSLSAQQASIEGTWRVSAGADTKGGPKEVVIRSDSSASWGKETVRWRLRKDQISIALGGEWETYKVKVKSKRLTLSGGDLQKPITLTRVGPPTARPDSIPVPPDPDQAY